MRPRWSWGPTAIRGTKEEGAEGLTGASGGRAERLAVFRRGGERGKMGGIIGDTGYLELGRTSGDRRLRKLSYSKFSEYPTEASCSSPSATGMWVRLHSIPSNSTNTPTGTDDVASQLTNLPDFLLGFASRANWLRCCLWR